MPKVCEDETLPRPPSGASQNNRIHIHPLDNTINLSVHQHLYPPGRMLHIVRQWTKATDKANQQQVWSITRLLSVFCSQGSYVSAVPNQVKGFAGRNESEQYPPLIRHIFLQKRKKLR